MIYNLDFVKIENVTVGTRLHADGGFTCIPKGAIRTVKQDANENLFVRCSKDKHFLDGQASQDGRYIGFYATGKKGKEE